MLVPRFAPRRFLSAVRQAYKAASTTYSRILRVNAAPVEHLYPDLGKYANQAAMYSQSPWVYVASSKIGRAGALVELELYEAAGTEKTKVESHPILDLFKKPNAFQSKFEFMEATITFLQINGNAYWFLSKDDAGNVLEMLILRPDRVSIAPGEVNNRPVKGYVYSVEGTDVPLSPDEVIHFKRFNPKDDYYGLSPMEAAATGIQSDQGMGTWNRNFFSRDNAVPAGIVTIKSFVTDPEYERLQNDWQRNYGGQKRKTAFIRGADISYTDIGNSHHDMDFIQGREFEKKLIMLVYGIPAGMLDENATEANSNTGYQVFNDQTLWPCMVELTQKLTAELCPLFGENLVMEPEDIRTVNAAQTLEEFKAFSMILSINELRKKYLSFAPVGWGETPPAGAGAAAITGQVVKFDGTPKQVVTTPADEKVKQEMSTADSEIKALRLSSGKKSAAPCYVLLSLANDPTLTAIQSTLKTDNPEVTWEDPADFHITLVYATDSVDEALARDILPHSIKPITLTVGPVGTFGQKIPTPFYLAVQMTPALKALQAGLYASFQSCGLTMSEYSDPAGWQPHITLGYLPDPSQAPTYEGTVSVSSQSLLCSMAGSDDFTLTYETKALPEAIPPIELIPDVPRVPLTRRQRDVIRQFVTFAGKGKDRPFDFKSLPDAWVLIAQSLQDAGQLDLLTIKAVTPAAARLGSGGQPDPFGKEKEKDAKKLSAAMLAALQSVQADIVDGIKHIVSTQPADLPAAIDNHFDNKWWKAVLAALISVMYAVYDSAMEQAATDTADLINMQTGVGYDSGAVGPMTAERTQDWESNWLPGIVDTTRDGFRALLTRWGKAQAAKPADLISAVQESPLFDEGRCDGIGDNESTRLWGAAVWIALALIGPSVIQAITADQVDDLIPAHYGCVCGSTAELVYDGNILIRLDQRWYTIKDGHKICPQCAGRDGKLFSEIVEQGL